MKYRFASVTVVLTCVTSELFHLIAHFIFLHVDDEDQLSGGNGSDLEQNEENVADQKEEEGESSAEDDAEDDDSEETSEDDNGSDLESDGTFHF